tara:strand:+ start:1943 stop:5827 length:3885 start_codon:yes stop_codon:yes gene_type:complete
MSDTFSNPSLFTSPTLMKSDDDVLLDATQSKQSVLSEEELKRAEAAARQFGFDQPIPRASPQQIEAAKEHFDAPDPDAAAKQEYMDRSKALSMIRDVPLVGGFLESLATRDLELDAEIAADREKQLQEKYAPYDPGIVRMDPELGLVFEKLDPETGEPRLYPQSEEGIEKQELGERIKDVQEKTSGLLSPYALLQSEETAGVPEGTIDYTGGAYGTAQGALAALSFDPSPLSYGADLASAGLYRLEGDPETAADVLRWSLYGAGAGAAIAGGLKARRIMQARKGMIDQFVGAGKNVDEATDMADDLLIEARRVQRAMDEQAAAKKVKPAREAAEEGAEETVEEVAEEVELTFDVAPSGQWTSGLIDAVSTMPKKKPIDELLGLKADGRTFRGALSSAMDVSPGEIRGTGLYEYLQELKAGGRKDVTRQELLEYLDKNRIDFRSIHKGSAGDEQLTKLQTEVDDSFDVLADPLEEFRRAHTPHVDQHTFRHTVQGDPDEFMRSVDYVQDQIATSDYHPFAAYSGKDVLDPIDNAWLIKSGSGAPSEVALNNRMRGFFMGKRSLMPDGSLPSPENFGPSNFGGIDYDYNQSKYAKQLDEALEGDLIDEVYEVKTHYNKLAKDRNLGHPQEMEAFGGGTPSEKNVRKWLLEHDPEVRDLVPVFNADRFPNLAAGAGRVGAPRNQLDELLDKKVEDILEHYRRQVSSPDDVFLRPTGDEKTRNPLKLLDRWTSDTTSPQVRRMGADQQMRADIRRTELRPWNEQNIRYGSGKPQSPEMMDVEFDELEMLANQLGSDRAIARKNRTYNDLYEYAVQRRDARRLTEAPEWDQWTRARGSLDEYADAMDVQPTRFGDVTLEGGNNPGYREVLIQFDSPSLRVVEDVILGEKRPNLDLIGTMYRADNSILPGGYPGHQRIPSTSITGRNPEHDAARFEKARPYFVEKYGDDFPKSIDEYPDWYQSHKDNLYTQGTGGALQGSHHSDPNIMMHLRMTEQYTIGPDGKKKRILLVEELQSDQHQRAGQYGGYRPSQPDIYKLETEQRKGFAIEAQMETVLDEVLGKHGFDITKVTSPNLSPAAGGGLGFTVNRNVKPGEFDGHFHNDELDQYVKGLGQDERNEIYEASVRLKDQTNEVNVLSERLNDLKQGEAVIPPAPFRKEGEWSALGVREATRIAARDGYDGIAFIGGEMGYHTSWLKPERSRKLYGSVIGGKSNGLIPKAFQRVTGRSLAPMELSTRSGTSMADRLDRLQLQQKAVALEQTDAAGNLVNQFNGILFDDELRKVMSQPQRLGNVTQPGAKK